MAADMSFYFKQASDIAWTLKVWMHMISIGKLFGSMRCTIGKTWGQQLTQRAQILPSLQAKKDQMAKKKRTNQRKKPHKKLRKFNNFVTLSGQFVQTRWRPVKVLYLATLCTWDRDFFRFCPEKAYQKSRKIHKKGIIYDMERVQSD